jgi:hypothetical protein
VAGALSSIAEGVYASTLGGDGKDGTDGPPGIFIMDCETFASKLF